MSRPEADEAPEAPERRCPHCGGPPSDITHHLSDLGYIHDDQRMVCADCGRSYTSGVPRGIAAREYWDDLVCPSCGRPGRVHRIAPKGAEDKEDVIGLHMKCPNRYQSPCPVCEHAIQPDDDIWQVAEHAGYDAPYACPYCTTPLKRDDLNGCYHFWTVQRLVGPHGYALVGWPSTTGEINPDEDRGYGHVGGAVRPGEQPGA